MTIFIATGNPEKLNNFKLFFSWIDASLKIDMIPDKIEVDESGTTIAENSRLKILPYKGKYDSPVITNDFGLEFPPSINELNNSSQVKRQALKGEDPQTLDQKTIASKMISYYRKIARKHGGSINCKALDVFTILLPNGIIRQEKSERSYLLKDRDVTEFNEYHPLDSLRLNSKIGKFMDEFNGTDSKLDKAPLVDALRKLIQ